MTKFHRPKGLPILEARSPSPETTQSTASPFHTGQRAKLLKRPLTRRIVFNAPTGRDVGYLLPVTIGGQTLELDFGTGIERPASNEMLGLLVADGNRCVYPSLTPASEGGQNPHYLRSRQVTNVPDAAREKTFNMT